MFLVALAFAAILARHGATSNIVVPWKGATEKSHRVVLANWDVLDQSMRDLMNTDHFQNLYYVLEKKTPQLGVSNECTVILSEMTRGLRKLQDWPITMLDATGRMPNGIISGSITDLGNYDQCVNIKVADDKKKQEGPKFRGQYCLVNVRPSLPTKPKILTAFNTIEPFLNYTTDNHLLDEMRKFAPKYYDIPFTIGVCIPSICTGDDLNNIVSYMASKVGLTAVTNRCEIKEEWKIDGIQAFILFVIGLLVALCIVGTIIDENFENKTSNDLKQTTLKELLVSFSVSRNFSRLMSINPSDSSELLFLHGIRFFSVNWVLLGHSYLIQNFEAIQSTKNIRSFMESAPFQLVTGGGIAVDSFVLISCFLLTYLTLKKTDREGTQIFKIPLIVFHRIFRILPQEMLTIGLMLLMPLVGSGPVFHDNMDFQVRNCRQNWWYNVLFINNFLPPSKMCLCHSWFLAVDFQLFILSMVFIMIAMKSMKTAITSAIVLTILSIIMTGWMTHWAELGPYFTFNNFNLEALGDFLTYCHMQTYSHIGPGCIGMILGVYLARRKTGLPHPVVVVAGWTVSSILIGAIMYYPVIWNRGLEPTSFEVLTFASLCRIMWALGVSWIVFACYTGSGGFVNTFLSWKVIIPLSRLNFMVYLVHLLVMYAHTANQRAVPMVLHLSVMYIYVGNVVFTYALAFITNILFESPIMQLEKHVMGMFQPISKRESVANGKHSTPNNNNNKIKIK